MKINLFVIFIALLLGISLSVPTEDLVLYKVPGYNYTWYSGYLQFNTGKYHYVYFQSQRDPQKDPVNWWFNGGPGCSSLIGMMYQNGPFVFKTNTTNLQINKYAWNRQSNLLYITTPGGVGFSQSYRNNTYSDETATQDNLKALLKFYEKFPNLKKNQLFLTGQSYAGIYVPYLTKAILEYNKLPSRQMTFNLKGFMVNNPCTQTVQCFEPHFAHSNSMYEYEYFWNHGFYTDQQYADVTGACALGYHTPQCVKIRDILDDKFDATNTSIYNIYAPCLYQYYDSQTPFNNSQQIFQLTQSGGRIKLLGGMSCSDSIGSDWFWNLPAIQQYLHVDKMKYQDCSSDVSHKYIWNSEQSYWIYKELMKNKTGLRIWVASGDHDADVPWTGTKSWISRLRDEQFLPIYDPWREWWVKGVHEHQDQVGGMTWGLRGIRYVSVKGAGHMIHKDKRLQSWVMVDSFLKGNNLPFKEQ